MRPLGKAASDDDRPLIERVRQGDQDAVRALYERYFDRIYNYAYARLGRAEDAEDLAIDTMTRGLTRLDLFQHLTAAQVASIMGKSVGAVQALQHRALGSLERTLQGRAVN